MDNNECAPAALIQEARARRRLREVSTVFGEALQADAPTLILRDLGEVVRVARIEWEKAASEVRPSWYRVGNPYPFDGGGQ